MRLLLFAAGVFGFLRLGAWVEVGLATLIHQTSISDNTFTTRSLVAPSNLVGGAAGGDVRLNWTAGQNGTGYAVSRVANGNSNDCSAAVFTSLATPAGTNYTDGGNDAPPGGWACYQVETGAGGWTSPGPNPTAAVQLGFVARSVAFNNAGDVSGCPGGEQSGAAGDLDCGDQIVIGFNQPVNTGTGPAAGDTVCANNASDTLWLGSTITNGACSSAEPVSLGTLTGSGVGGCDCRFAAGYAWDAGGQKLTVTIGARIAGDGHPALGGNAWTFKPTTDSARLQSATGNFHICDYNTSPNNCWPATP